MKLFALHISYSKKIRFILSFFGPDPDPKHCGLQLLHLRFILHKAAQAAGEEGNESGCGRDEREFLATMLQRESFGQKKVGSNEILLN